MLQEERQKEHLNVRAVHVRVGQDADLSITQPFQIRIAVPVMRIHPDGERNVMNRVGTKEFAALDFPGIEDLAAQRQHCLKFLA